MNHRIRVAFREWRENAVDPSPQAAFLAGWEAAERANNPDELVRTLQETAEERQRSRHRQLTKLALAEKKARGERAGGIPFGFKLAADGKSLDPEPTEQAIIHRVKRLRGEKSLRAIVAELAADGAVSRSGKPLTITQVGRIARGRPPVLRGRATDEAPF